MSVSGTVWTLTPSDSNVTGSADGNTYSVNVKYAATANSTYTLKAENGSFSDEVIITVQDINITWPTVTKSSDLTYGKKFKDYLTVKNDGSASLPTGSVNGTFTIKEAEQTPNAGSQTYTLVFKSDDNKYAVEKSGNSITINKAEIDLSKLVWTISQIFDYDKTSKSVTISADSANYDKLDIEYTDNSKTDAGNYTATATATVKSGFSTNYMIKAGTSIENCNWKINPANISDEVKKAITAYSGSYDGNNHDAVVKGEIAEGYTLAFSDSENGTYSETNPVVKNAGSKDLWVKISKTNYNDAKVKVIAEITPVTLTANDLEYSGASISKEYDGNTTCTLPEGGNVKVKSGSMKGSDEPITISGKAEYDSKDVASATKVVFTPDAIESGNYRLAATEKLNIIAKITATDACIDETAKSQSVVKNDGSFDEPVLKMIAADGSEELPCTITYSYAGKTSYNDVKNELDKLDVGATVQINYSFSTENSNYDVSGKNGIITVNIIDVAFTIGSDPATINNCVTIKENPVYGDSWNDIIKVKSGITAKVGTIGDNGTGSYTLEQSGKPDAGEQTYRILYNGTINNIEYKNIEVCKGTVNVSKKGLTIKAGDQNIEFGSELNLDDVNVSYDGFVNDETKDVLSGTLGFDTNYTKTSSVGGNYTVTPKGLTSGNYELSFVPGNITVTAKSLKDDDISLTVSGTYTYNGAEQTPSYEVKDGSIVLVKDADYEAIYSNNKDAGTATIKINGIGNYSGSVSSSFVINKKTVGLSWSPSESTLYYDGKEKLIEPAVTDLIGSDKVDATVNGEKATAIGDYCAEVSGLTGDDANNYVLSNEAECKHKYSIVSALDEVNVTPDTVTATIDTEKLTINLVGYKSESEEINITGKGALSSDKTKFTSDNGNIEYSVDSSKVTIMPVEIEIKPERIDVPSYDKISEEAKADGITNDVLSAIRNSATKSEGLTNAAAEKISKLAENMPDGAVKVEAEMSICIEPESFKGTEGNKVLRLEIKPVIKYLYKNSSGETVGEMKTETVDNKEILAPVKISIKLIDGMNPTNLFVKHYFDSAKSTYEVIKAKADGGIATWDMLSFSNVELYNDERTAKVEFNFTDGSSKTITFTPENIGESLPTDSKSGYSFKGWAKDTDTVYTDATLTDELLTSWANAGTITVTSKMEVNTSGGNSSGGGGGASIVQKPSINVGENGTVVLSEDGTKLTITANEGYVVKSVTLNGTEKGAVSSLTGLKTGDKVVVTFEAVQTQLDVSQFIDVKSGDWFYENVEYVVNKGLMNGISEIEFAPNSPTTRAMLMTILARYNGVDTTVDKNSGAKWYDKALAWAKEQGISDGTNPEKNITREQLATMLWRAAGEPKTTGTLSAFKDADKVSNYAKTAISWAVEKGIMNGKGKGILDPTNNATRAEMAAMLMRYCELDDSDK